MQISAQNLFPERRDQLLYQQQLGTLRAPQRVVLSHQALPLNGAGKHDRRALAALLQREAS